MKAQTYRILSLTKQLVTLLRQTLQTLKILELKVREEYRIPQSTLNKLINDVMGLWVVVALDSIKMKLEKEVESMSSAIDIESFKKCFEDSFPLDGLESE